jgi:DNA repair protein RadC
MTEQAKLSVKDWSPDDQPREKLLLKGVNSLSDAELLAIIIGSGSRDESVVQLSQRILQSVNSSINQLGKISINQLVSNFKGIGEAKAVSIVAALELGKRRKSSEVMNAGEIRTSKDTYNLFHPLLCDLHYEEFWLLFLNRSCRIIDKVKLSQGGVSETVVDTKIVFKEALLRLSTNIILCHNHPSGNVRPSSQDDRITLKIREGVKLLDMTLMDHVIVGDGKYYSYADEGKI